MRKGKLNPQNSLLEKCNKEWHLKSLSPIKKKKSPLTCIPGLWNYYHSHSFFCVVPSKTKTCTALPNFTRALTFLMFDQKHSTLVWHSTWHMLFSMRETLWCNLAISLQKLEILFQFLASAISRIAISNARAFGNDSDGLLTVNGQILNHWTIIQNSKTGSLDTKSVIFHNHLRSTVYPTDILEFYI